MPDVNRETIINGTPNKRIRNAYEVMKEDHNPTSAQEFYNVYSEYSIPVLIENSRYIFSEPYLGNVFYRDMMESGCVRFEDYFNEREKIKELMVNKESIMNEATKEWYQYLYEFVDSLYQSHRNSIVCEYVISEDEENSYAFLTEAYRFKHGEYNKDKVFETCNNLSSLGKVLYLSEHASSLDMEYELVSAIHTLHTDCVLTESMNDFSNAMDLIMLVNRMGKDTPIIESVNAFDNVHLKMLYKGLMKESVSDVLQESIISHIETVGDIDLPMHEAVNYLLEVRIDDTDGFYAEQSHIAEYDNTLRKYITYEHCLDEVLSDSIYSDGDAIFDGQELVKEYAESQGYDSSTLTVNDAVILITEAVAELRESLEDLENGAYLTEYRNDGKQTGLMKKHASNLREEDNKESQKNKKSDKWKDDIKSQVPDEDEDVEDNENDDKDKKKDDKKESKDKDNDDSLNIGKPKLAKQDFHSKVQAKALDIDVKSKTIGGKVKKLATDVKQTGKAILKVPGNIVSQLKSLISEWNSWNDDKRKEAILKPGYRKGFWAKFRTVVTYGLSWAISPCFVVITYMARKASAEKNKYLRNELALELQTEIKVTDAKIEDASAKGDNKQKYQLMRIRDKLEKERVRVISNSKYV